MRSERIDRTPISRLSAADYRRSVRRVLLLCGLGGAAVSGLLSFIKFVIPAAVERSWLGVLVAGIEIAAIGPLFALSFRLERRSGASQLTVRATGAKQISRTARRMNELENLV
jgi:hypothetical protein